TDFKLEHCTPIVVSACWPIVIVTAVVNGVAGCATTGGSTSGLASTATAVSCVSVTSTSLFCRTWKKCRLLPPAATVPEKFSVTVGGATVVGTGTGSPPFSHADAATANAMAQPSARTFPDISCMLAHTAGEMDVMRKSSIFIAGTSAVPG